MTRICVVVIAVFAVGCGGSTPEAPAAAASDPVVASPAAATAPASPESSPPASAEEAYDKAAALASAAQFDRAHSAFASASRTFPEDESIAAGLAILDDRRESRVSNDATLRIFRAFDHANAGRWVEAHADIAAAIAQAPRYARVHSAHGNILLMEERLDDAIAAFGRAIETDPQFWEAHFNRGSAYMSRAATSQKVEDATAAMLDLSRAHELAPNVAAPIFQRGVLFALAEEWSMAIADLDKAIAIAPRHGDAYYNRGLARQNTGDTDRAIADYSRAIELHPNEAPPLINRGLLYARQKNYDAALADLDKAAAVAPRILNSRLEKAGVLEAMGRREDAIREWEVVADKGTGDTAALGAYARERLAALRQQRQ